MSSKVCIIILTHNECTNLLECLDSLSKVDHRPLEIVVVDNQSSDDSQIAVQKAFPNVTLIETGANLGYAEGNNVGLRYALAHDAKYVLLLNSDTIVAENFLSELVGVAETLPEVAFLGPLVYHFDEPGVIQSAGGQMTRSWRSSHRGQNELDEGQYNEVEIVEWVSGCAILARSSLIGKIGLLDPDFFIYSEEVDWCLRGREAGYRTIIVPNSKVWHKGVQRDYRPGPRVTYLSARNELLLLTKHRAGRIAITRALLRDGRTLTSWSLRRRWRSRRTHRNALAFALRDFMLGRYGAPPETF